ncbi:hypothetical protein GJ496_001591 [Pomphorhynchus laevis]|nr:hypothetical protein GJ496_001591 [Pomphorhynchus laevis]
MKRSFDFGTDAYNLWTLFKEAGYDDAAEELSISKCCDLLPISLRMNMYHSNLHFKVVRTFESTDDLLMLMRTLQFLGFNFDILSIDKVRSSVHNSLDFNLVIALVSRLCQDARSPVIRDLWGPYLEMPLKRLRSQSLALQNEKSVMPTHGESSYWRVQICKCHKTKYCVLTRLVKDRKLIKSWNSLYPPATSGDWAHTRLDLKTVIVAMSADMLHKKPETYSI